MALALIAALIVAFSGGPASAQVPGTNGLIAFDRGGDLFTVRPDGTGEVNINNHPAFDHSPSWSPDATKLVFVRIPVDPEGESAELYTMDANGGNVTPLPDVFPDQFEVTHLQPAWSPDGQKIAFRLLAEEPETEGIYVVNADGSNITQLTKGSRDSYPAWAPDGAKIAISRSGSIVTMNADGTDATVRVQGTNSGNDLVRHEAPTWSPDGSLIAYHTRNNITRRAQIRVNDGATDRAVFERSMDNTRTVEEPEWSPDGTTIAFEWDRRIFTMSDAGGGVTQVAAAGSAVVGARAPSWATAGPPRPSRCERFSSLPLAQLPPQFRRDVALLDLGFDQPVLCVNGRLIIDLSRIPVRLPVRLEVGGLPSGGTKIFIRPPGKETGPPAGETLPRLRLDDLLKQKNQVRPE